MISQFYILSERGDKIVFKDYRFDVIRSEEIFFKEITASKRKDACFTSNGIQFFQIKRNSLWYVCCTRENVSAMIGINVLELIYSILKDFLGEITEESVRKNLC